MIAREALFRNERGASDAVPKFSDIRIGRPDYELEHPRGLSAKPLRFPSRGEGREAHA